MMGFPGFQSAFVFPSFFHSFVFGLGYVMNAIYGIVSWVGLHQREGVVPQISSSQEFSEMPSHISAIAARIIRENSPVMTFGRFSEKFGGKEKDGVCAFCLNSMEEKDEVRELCNCVHVFHRNCLDTWLNHHHMTCPLCRRCLLPGRERVSDDQVQIVDQLSYFLGDDLMNS